MFGEECSLFGDFEKGKREVEWDLEVEVAARIGHLQHLMETVHPELMERLDARRVRMLRPSEFVEYPVGTWVKVAGGRGDKLSAKYVGLYRVTRRLDKGTYLVETVMGGRVDGPVHASRLKSVSPEAAERLMLPEARAVELPAGSPQAEGVLEVDSIIAHRRVRVGRREVTELRVRWRGYGEQDDTWEPMSSFQTSGVVSEYWNRVGGVAAIASGIVRPSFGRLTDEMVRFLRGSMGACDVDLFAGEWKGSLCRLAVRDFHKEAKARTSPGSKVLVNPPWYFYMWLGDWLVEFAKGCEIVVVVPYFKGYEKVIARWPGVRWARKIEFPRSVKCWFTDGAGKAREAPQWRCDVWIGTIVSE
jgi:hypothetical protein